MFLRKLFYLLTFRKFPKFIGASGTAFGRIAAADTRAEDLRGKIIAANDSITLKNLQAEKMLADVKDVHVRMDGLEAKHTEIDKLLG